MTLEAGLPAKSRFWDQNKEESLVRLGAQSTNQPQPFPEGSPPLPTTSTAALQALDFCADSEECPGCICQFQLKGCMQKGGPRKVWDGAILLFLRVFPMCRDQGSRSEEYASREEISILGLFSAQGY